MAKKEKTVSYRRAEWLDDAVGLTLEWCLREAHKKLTTIDDRTISRGGQDIKSVKLKDCSSGGMFLHLTAETPGEHASLVPKVSPQAKELDLKTAKPPAAGEWLDGDAFLYVNSDHVCVCATAFHDAAIRTFLYELFKKAKLRKDSIRFDLMKAADISKIKLLRSQGVKELEIRATLFQATADYERRKAHATGILGGAAKHIKSFLKKPNDVTPDGLRIMLTLKTDGRFTNGLALGEKRIEQIAADVVNNSEEGDDYVIITGTGQKISAKEIFMRSKVSIDAEGKSVQRDKAWKELEHFYKTLSSVGALEQ